MEWQKNRNFIFPVNKYSDYNGSYNSSSTFKREVNNMFNNPDSCISYERILCKFDCFKLSEAYFSSVVVQNLQNFLPTF